MTWKKSNVLVSLICMSIMVVAMTSIVPVSAVTVVYVNPEKVASVTWEPGKQFTVDINVDAVSNLFAWEVSLGWNATVLDLVDVTEGPFLRAQPGGTFFVVQRSEDIEPVDPPGWPTEQLPEGFVIVSCTTLGEFIGQGGSGTFATATFLVETYGESPLDLHNTLLLAAEGPYIDTEIDHSVRDGYFVNVGVPEALFSYTPSLPPVNEALTFDASASYDLEGPIAKYDWDFADGNITTTTDPIITHVYTSVGTYTVNLTVTDNEGLTNSQLQTIVVRYHHDVAVTFISLSTVDVKPGEPVTVNVTVENKGVEPETFDVTVYYEETALPSKSVSNLAANATQTLTFVWDTTGVAAGDYRIKAVASTVTGETYVENNTYIDGDVGVTATGQSLPTTLIIAAVGAVAAIAGIGLFFLRRRKRPSAT